MIHFYKRKRKFGGKLEIKDIEFFGNHDWEAAIKLTVWVFKPLLAKRLGDWEKNVPKNKNMDEFSGQLFHFPHFFMVKWVINHRNILSEWQCLVCKPKSQQEHFIVASMETTKLILAWFTSTRESGNLVENCKSNIYNFVGIMTERRW